MLARRATFEHPTAGRVELPLLVPAFSSKGFELIYKGKRRKQHSELAYQLEDFSKRPQRAVLISAYDVHFEYFKPPDLSPQAPYIYLKNVHLAFLDSGGYELAPEYDSTEPRRFSREPERFTIDHYHAVLDRIVAKGYPPPIVIANYDHSRARKRKSLDQQIREARATFGRYKGFASDFILKPWKGNSVEPANLSDSAISSLRGFDIIGVTEKELGRDLLVRLQCVALLRQKLDAQGLHAKPIHVWGGLEPLTAPLFFFAGAQIVDGLSWLRYAYRNGVAIVRDTYCILSGDLGLGTNSKLNHAYVSLTNLAALENMTVALQQWVDLEGTDFSMFPEEIRRHLADAYQVMCAKIPGLRNDRPGSQIRKQKEGQ
jgi:hypothetical protein